jgi:hypothetical protein
LIEFNFLLIRLVLFDLNSFDCLTNFFWAQRSSSEIPLNPITLRKPVGTDKASKTDQRKRFSTPHCLRMHQRGFPIVKSLQFRASPQKIDPPAKQNSYQLFTHAAAHRSPEIV